MLVQDHDTTQAAACLWIASGNLNDPPEAQGLAHFCEHMLFLGTEKYPEEYTYSSFIQTHGGSKNAATGENYTYYYFSIQNEFFNRALDIFSEFFKHPLFTQTATEREMNAVDNEFKKNLSNEARQGGQLLNMLSVDGSPVNHFGTGNLNTLNKPNIRELLLDYYERNYSANLMSVCLVGNYPLDELEHMANAQFSQIADKGLTLKKYS
jgi:insulysin